MNTNENPLNLTATPGVATNVAGGVGYIVDIIVIRLEISDKDAKQLVDKDPSLLVVEATFNREDLKITSSRINVIEFKSGKSFEFIENPSVLKDDLMKNKLKLKIKHAGKDLGIAAVDWPESFLNCLIDPACMGELTHVFESEYRNCDTDKKCGTIEVIVRLQTKCSEWNDEDVCGPREDVAKAANKIIDPNDILFVVGEDKNPCCCSQVGLIPATDSDKALHPTCLDLSNFRSVNGKTVPNTDILNTLDPACGELKKVTNQYQKLIDSLMGKPKPSPCCSKKAETQAHPDPCLTSCNTNKPVASSSCTDFNPTNNYNHSQMSQSNVCSDEGLFAPENIVNFCHKNSVPELIENVPVQPRCCPLCKENLSWLPKLAACPKCGYKPIPQFDEKPYNDQLTANEILLGYMEKGSSCGDDEDPIDKNCPQTDQSKSHCRCTCNPKKVCAYCRIRKLCADVFQSDGQRKEDECGKCETKSSELYNICKTNSKDCRPHLTRVFSELKDLYDIRDIKKKDFEKDERCERELNRGKGNQRACDKQNKEKLNCRTKAKGQVDESERRQFLVKNFQSARKVCRGKAYNYRMVRKYPGVQVGHKTCINGFAGRKNVPPNMGWLWNVEAKGIRAGWKPGAIRKPIKELMKYFLRDFPADTLRVSQYSYRRRRNGYGNQGGEEEEELLQKPTLHICKKNGEYFITLRPLKDPEALKECADPYLNMQPIQFKIIKNPLAMEMRKLKKCLKGMGFSKCTCHKPIVDCFCRSFLDKKRLEYQCNKEARNRKLPLCNDSLVLSDTTESETEFDFGVTPPAGVIKPERLKKRNFVNTGSQYDEQDWNVPPLYPKEPNKYMKLYNCAIGERFGKAFGPYGPGGYTPGAVPTAGVYGGCGGRGGGGKAGGRGGAAGRWSAGMGGKGKGVAGAKGSANKPNLPGGGTVDMMKYLNKSKGRKLSPAELAEKRKKRLRELAGVAPPLICMVDRRAKPVDPCIIPCQPLTCCGDVCLRDTRIC
ncbi:uncharacterized protein LOC131806792 [Musca domestica]|uniref:Uncharacterized protein LOC131806792 n=1 Tax=Musca domestica TaxID=7370 RepID=A0ABM3VNS4_MUSDO|nr:uncharacterized protein LOC131806792 [Musca domestica]